MVSDNIVLSDLPWVLVWVEWLSGKLGIGCDGWSM